MVIASGAGVALKVRASVFTPVIVPAAGSPSQLYPSCTSVETLGALAANAIKKLCVAPAAIATGVLSVPVSVFVCGSVV